MKRFTFLVVFIVLLLSVGVITTSGVLRGDELGEPIVDALQNPWIGTVCKPDVTVV